MPSLTPHAGKDSQRADLRLPGITRLTPHPVRATGEDMGNRLGSQRWGDPEATRINVEPAKDCKSLPAQPSVVVWPPSGVRGEKSSVKAHKREVSLITSPEGVLPLAAAPRRRVWGGGSLEKEKAAYRCAEGRRKVREPGPKPPTKNDTKSRCCVRRKAY